MCAEPRSPDLRAYAGDIVRTLPPLWDKLRQLVPVGVYRKDNTENAAQLLYGYVSELGCLYVELYGQYQ